MRNFLYNKSDVLVAAVIVIVAIIIIWSRIDAIMKSDNPSATKQPAKTTTEQAGTDAAADDDTVQPPAGDAGAGSQGTTAADQTSTGEGMAPLADGTEVTLTVQSGMSSDQIAVALKDAGLIASSDEFNTAVTAKGAEKKLRAGSFKIPAGSSVDAIIDILTKSS
ncbi:MAG: endolytic transglycosylase MltG [Clostridiales Family XIII bacterium]|nr:endolytic transglycosylase MltG [Clostridiales Family XIII bacterium]